MERGVVKEARPCLKADCKENGKSKIVKLLAWISRYDFHAEHKSKQAKKTSSIIHKGIVFLYGYCHYYCPNWPTMLQLCDMHRSSLVSNSSNSLMTWMTGSNYCKDQPKWVCLSSLLSLFLLFSLPPFLPCFFPFSPFHKLTLCCMNQTVRELCSGLLCSFLVSAAPYFAPRLVALCSHMHGLTEDSLLDIIWIIEMPIRHNEQAIEECII